MKIAPATDEMISGMATPSWGSTQANDAMIAKMIINKACNLSPFRSERTKATPSTIIDMGTITKKATETM